MNDIFAKIADQKIREAQQRGDFENLEGAGKPQALEDYFRVPEDVRMAYTVLQNANCTPPELALKNEIVQIEDMLASIQDEQEKYRQIKKLNYLVTKLNTIRQTPINMEEQQYYSRVVSKITVSSPKERKDE